MGQPFSQSRREDGPLRVLSNDLEGQHGDALSLRELEARRLDLGLPRRRPLQRPAQRPRADENNRDQEHGGAGRGGEPTPAPGPRRSRARSRPVGGGLHGAQGERQVVDRLIAFLRALFEAAPHQLLERRRQWALERGEGRRVVAQDRGDHVGAGVAAERPLAGEHLEQHRAEREDVGALVGRLAAQLLGRHVAQGADDRPVLGLDGQGRGSRSWASRFELMQLGEPEVEDLDRAILGDEDVLRLEIPVDDAAGVGCGQTVGDLDRDLDRPPRGEVRLPQPLPKAAAAQQLRHDVGHPLVLADVIDGEDVRVVQRTGGPRLAFEARDPARITGCGRRQRLDRHLAVEPRVVRLPDLAHPTRPYPGDDPIVRDGLPNHAAPLTPGDRPFPCWWS